MTIRHPIRGLLGGFFLGLGLALALLFLGVAVLGTWTVIGLVVAFALLGLLFALAWPPKRAMPRG